MAFVLDFDFVVDVLYMSISQVYEHKIYRYLENPLESLTSIKDDEHIVAYRLKSGARKTKLEIMHRWMDK